MSSLNCFRPSWKKKNTEKNRGEKGSDDESNVKAVHVKLDHLRESSETSELRSTSFSVEVPFRIAGNSRCKVKVMNHESPVIADSGVIDYEGGDEHDEASRRKRDPEFNFQPFSGNVEQRRSNVRDECKWTSERSRTRSCSNLDAGRFCTSYGIGIFSCGLATLNQ